MENKLITQMLTKQDLVDNFRRIGITDGTILEVHSSLSSLGFVLGGAQTVVDALIEAVGKNGTIVMPLQFSDNTEPGEWCNPPLAIELIAKAREEMPGFDINACEAPYMGAVVNNFRRRPEVIYSASPSCAFVAYGHYAPLICNRQSYHFPLGEDSPCARLVEKKAKFICIGCHLDKLTSLHLAQYRADYYPIAVNGAAIMQNDKKVWKKYLDLYDADSDDFIKIETGLIKKGLLRVDKIGQAAIYFGQTDLVVDAYTKHLDELSIVSLYR